MPLTPGLAQTPLVDAEGFMSQPWQTHFRDVQTSLDLSPARIGVKGIDTETLAGIGALPPTPILPDAPLQTGLYRVTVALRVTVPATTSSSVAVVLHWFDGVDCTLVIVPAVTGNTPAAVGTGTALIHVVADLNSLVMISTVYASAPDPMMKYALHVVLEQMGELMGRPFYGSDVPKKPSITAAQLGFRPQPVRPRVPGETEAQYRKYVQQMEGGQARTLAHARGLNTSGMAWDGKQFTDANWSPWYADPGVMGPVAVMAAGGIGGAVAGGGGAGGSTVGGLVAPTPAPAVAAGGTAAGLPGGVLPVTAATTAGATAAEIAAKKAAEEAAKKAGGMAGGGLWGTGLTTADLIGGGANWFQKLYNARAASSAASRADQATQDALDFAKQQYAENARREQERWDATEARRVPYRAASQDVLAEFRKLLGDSTMAVYFDARSHRFFEHDDYPRTGERTPLSAKEQAQFTARRLRAEPDNGTRGYTLPLSVLVGAPPRKDGPS